MGALKQGLLKSLRPYNNVCVPPLNCSWILFWLTHHHHHHWCQHTPFAQFNRSSWQDHSTCKIAEKYVFLYFLPKNKILIRIPAKIWKHHQRIAKSQWLTRQSHNNQRLTGFCRNTVFVKEEIFLYPWVLNDGARFCSFKPCRPRDYVVRRWGRREGVIICEERFSLISPQFGLRAQEEWSQNGRLEKIWFYEKKRGLRRGREESWCL